MYRREQAVFGLVRIMAVSKTFMVIAVFLIVGYEEGAVCNSKWKSVLETDDYGNSRGSKEQLIKYVLSGADMRIKIHKLDFGADVLMDVNNAYVTDNDICCQSIMHIGKDSWDTFTRYVYWRFLLICTTGHVNQARWYVGDHSKPEADTTTKMAITWFIRTINCDDYKNGTTPIYCTNQIACGPKSNLFDAVATGSDLRVVDEGLGYATRLEHAAYSKRKNTIGAESIWAVSQVAVDKHAVFTNDAFWWFTLWSSEGDVDMSRWSIGEHKNSGHSKSKFDIKWYADSCWQLAYSHDGNGVPMDGSLDLLKAGILSGHRVRIVVGPYSIEADNLLIKDGQVSAQLLGHVSKKDVDVFQEDVYWFWQHVATTGEVETIRPFVGDIKYKGMSGGRHSVKWFMDTRHWKRAISTFNSKTVTKKSKEDLIDSVRSHGSSVRIIVKENDNHIMAIRADNLGFNSNNTEISAQSIRNVGHFYPAGSVREFPSSPYWEFTSISTLGICVKSKWLVGKDTDVGFEVKQVITEWFTS
ncbi:Hypothetical predicted protein [Mytilus galloprovincialis]|uniref:Uncharacterized protein n=2 Tax=Mytilus galloprovincialis TaxID=29158 RepID=A0A8B6CPH1_MYTGA|nr:Hypothetical predicted protein [Mytilus galloprovincialis]